MEVSVICASASAKDKHKGLHPASRNHNSTNDSGYCSDILASPECTSGSRIPQVVEAKEVACLTPVILERRTGRLTSTPQSPSSPDIGLVLSPPLPEIEDVEGISRCRQMSAGDSAMYITTPIEICELEMTCDKDSDKVENLLPINEQSKLVSKETKSTSSKRAASKKISLRLIRKCKKPSNVLIRMLKEADYLVYKVLKYMSGEDLLHLSHVNKQLRDTILQDKGLDRRRMAFINGRRKDLEHVGKENFKLKNCEQAGTSFGTLSPRKELSAIHNICAPSPKKASPSFTIKSLTLSERFIEEGQRLPQGEELQKCVKCKAPAKVLKPHQRAVCSRKTCGYDYCTRCHLSYHLKPQDCSVLKPRTRQGSGIFSNKCKRSLRRL
ncbi:F-box only protein 5-like [Cherax quadricarinatus]|nr:F-box only protein 5-like [Cherax quadricarinatus]XP_053648670.1 F-box only protein 5-like [Cherax quadricarinatus]